MPSLEHTAAEIFLQDAQIIIALYNLKSLLLPLQARYEILRGCLAELQRVCIVSAGCCLPPPFQELRPSFVTSNGCADGQPKIIEAENGFSPSQLAGEQLRHVAEACEVQ